jgi:hypothetical protein
MPNLHSLGGSPTGTVSRFIRDQILLNSLRHKLRVTTSLVTAIELVRPVCLHFGFTEVIAASFPRVSFDPPLDTPWCEIRLPISGDRVLLLRGAPNKARTFFLDQLLRIISTWLLDPATAVSGSAGTVIAHLESFSSRKSELKVAVQGNG